MFDVVFHFYGRCLGGRGQHNVKMCMSIYFATFSKPLIGRERTIGSPNSLLNVKLALIKSYWTGKKSTKTTVACSLHKIKSKLNLMKLSIRLIFIHFTFYDQNWLGSVQVLYKQVFPNSRPPLNKQNKHGISPPALKCFYNTWMAIRLNMRDILY